MHNMLDPNNCQPLLLNPADQLNEIGNLRLRQTSGNLVEEQYCRI